MSKVTVVYGQSMNISFRGMKAALGEELAKGHAAVFVNTKWTAAKVLYPDDHIHYHRAPRGHSFNVNDIISMPTKIPTKRLVFGVEGLAKALREHAVFLKNDGKRAS